MPSRRRGRPRKDVLREAGELQRSRSGFRCGFGLRKGFVDVRRNVLELADIDAAVFGRAPFGVLGGEVLGRVPEPWCVVLLRRDGDPVAGKWPGPRTDLQSAADAAGVAARGPALGMATDLPNPPPDSKTCGV